MPLRYPEQVQELRLWWKEVTGKFSYPLLGEDTRWHGQDGMCIFRDAGDPGHEIEWVFIVARAR